MRRVTLRATGALAAACAIGGCTSLLGRFTVESDESTADASHDAPTDGTAAADGGGEDGGRSDALADAGSDGASNDAPGDGASGTLDCTTWAYATPIVLETLSAGNRQVQGALSIYPLMTGSGTNIRVIAGKGDTEAFSLYTLDRTMSPPAVSALTSPSYFQSTFSGLHRGAGSAATYTVVTGSVRSAGGVAASYDAWVIPDNLPGTGPLPTPFTVYQLTPVQATPVGQLHLLPLSSSELFTIVENPITGTPTTYSAGAGIATPSSPLSTLAPVASSIYADDLTNMQLFHNAVNAQVYVFSENDLSSPGLSAWSLPDTAPADAAAPTKREVGALAAYIQAIGENTTTSAADVAYVEATINGGVIHDETVRVGTVPYSNATPDLDTWVSTDLTAARTYTGVGTLDAPIGVTCGSRWSQDNIMLLGPGLKSAADGGVDTGLALLWVDATGTIHAEERGTNRLLTTLDDFSGVAATPISIGPQGKNARWAVVWVETKTDDAGKYDVISYNELTCQ
ncbi:MAG TPA: hypothetical protein VMI75_24720 [Polyangiaceae bacterium]|nr:hypothetical protein [Polyangiaceae bacterium]